MKCVSREEIAVDNIVLMAIWVGLMTALQEPDGLRLTGN
jgi:hypothetical protein